MSRIEPISNDGQRNGSQHPFKEEDENKNFEDHLKEAKGHAPFPKPPPRKQDEHDVDSIQPINTRYGYQNEKALQKKILKQSIKKQRNDFYF